MKVENRPDGWHLLGPGGEHYGPYVTLLELEDVLDLLENREELKARERAKNPSTTTDGDGSAPRFVV